MSIKHKKQNKTQYMLQWYSHKKYTIQHFWKWNLCGKVAAILFTLEIKEGNDPCIKLCKFQSPEVGLSKEF